MGYRNCPACGSQNRDTDEKCYSCEGELEPKKAAAPGGVVEAPVAPGLEHEASSRRFQQILDENHAHRKSSWLHGLRAGAAGGAFLGFFYGIYLAFFGALFGSLLGVGQGLGSELTGAAVGGGIMFGIGFGSQLIYSIFIGVVCGALDVLCYQMDSGKIGWWVGLVWGVFSLLFLGDSFLGVLISGGWGWATGWMAAFAEKSWFRKQYAEM